MAISAGPSVIETAIAVSTVSPRPGPNALSNGGKVQDGRGHGGTPAGDDEVPQADHGERVPSGQDARGWPRRARRGTRSELLRAKHEAATTHDCGDYRSVR
jgi:hypothetical protein